MIEEHNQKFTRWSVTAGFIMIRLLCQDCFYILLALKSVEHPHVSILSREMFYEWSFQEFNNTTTNKHVGSINRWKPMEYEDSKATTNYLLNKKLAILHVWSRYSTTTKMGPTNLRTRPSCWRPFLFMPPAQFSNTIPLLSLLYMLSSCVYIHRILEQDWCKNWQKNMTKWSSNLQGSPRYSQHQWLAKSIPTNSTTAPSALSKPGFISPWK